MKKKIKKFKVGMDSETYAISLVDEPAIEENFIALAKQEEKMEVKLSDDDRHMLYGAVLVPDKDIYRNNGENEFYLSFSKESIEKMSQDFLKEYRQHEVTVGHEDIANEVCVVESWIKADLFKDKSVALGLNEQLPVGTWFCGMKVNNIETWERIKAGELHGFSVESMISLEEFEKNNNMENLDIKDMAFWKRLKEMLVEAFASEEVEKEPISEEIDLADIDVTKLEAEEPTQTEGEEFPEIVTETPDEPKTVKEEDIEVIHVEADPPQKDEEQPRDEKGRFAPKEDNKHLEELVNSLKDEINALKEMNSTLNDKVKELSKEPSAKPVNTNAKPSVAEVGVNGSAYQNWREQMRSLMG